MAPVIGRTPGTRPISPSVDSATPAAPSAPAAETRSTGWSPSVRSAAPVGKPAASAAQVATEFFSAFQKKDLATFEKLYAPGADFHDPIYDLNGRDEVLHMWKTLFTAGKDLKLTFDVIDSGPGRAKVAWKADYKVFGRPVHNEAVSELTVKDGKITHQEDSWSWSKWARQALPLGPLVDFPPVKALLRFFMRSA